MNQKPRFDWSNLKRDYEEMKSINTIARMYGCSAAAVHYRIKQMNIPIFSQKIEIDNVRELYEKHKSVLKVSKIIGCSKNTVIQRLKELGIPRNHEKKSISVHVGFGRLGEKIALSILQESSDMTGNDVHYPFDIEWKEKKVDAKISRLGYRHKRKKPSWSFGIRDKSKSDLFCCIGLNEYGLIGKVFLIPQSEVPSGILGISNTKSKYDKYMLEVNKDELNRLIYEAKRIG